MPAAMMMNVEIGRIIERIKKALKNLIEYQCQ